VPPPCFNCLRGMCLTHGPTDTRSTEPERNEESEVPQQEVSERAKRTRRTKPDAALTDQQSTGRKRAARIYPLDRKQPCEWRGQPRKGGGLVPIQGCDDGLQLARHHGPDKNTLNNDEGNVHRICNHCHNRWHSKNDKNYDPNKPLKD